MNLSNVTLVAADCRRPDLAAIAIAECQRHIRFAKTMLFTSENTHANSVHIPPFIGLEDYCRFIVKELVKYVTTSHVLVVQWDGYVVHPNAWRAEFLDYDFIGAPWSVGDNGLNGGFSLRSKKLLEALASDEFLGPFRPEDHYICVQHRQTLETKFGIRFAPNSIANKFSSEGGIHCGQFGFHSFMTRLPHSTHRPLVFHHSGDIGDLIYGLPTIKMLGGGVLFITPDNRTDQPTRIIPTADTVANISPLLEVQSYIHRCLWLQERPMSIDFDLNAFRRVLCGNPNSESVFRHTLNAFDADYPEDKPWLTVDFALSIPDRPIVVARSLRYWNAAFPWKDLVTRYGRWMAFVGYPEEYSDFCGKFGNVAYLPTTDLLALARIIAGARVCIMNQSAPCAIAIGLGKNLVQETWKDDANCMFDRDNAVYCPFDKAEIPKGWL